MSKLKSCATILTMFAEVIAVCASILSQDKPAQAPTPPVDLINADRPGLADGSNVIGRHHSQIELGAQWERHDSSGTRDRRFFVPALVRYGLSDQWEMRVETSAAYATATINGQTTVGSAPTSIGAKFHFQDGDGPRRPSLGTIIRVSPPSGSAIFTANRTQIDLRFAADWDLVKGGLWSLNPNVGIASYDAGDGTNFFAGLYALTVNYNPTPHLNFFIDAGLQAPEQRHGLTGLTIDAGVAVIVGENIQFDLSIGQGVNGQTTPHPFIGFGLSRRF